MIIVILVIGLVFRLILIDQSLWFDEAISLVSAKNLDFWKFVSSYPIGDFHPPGFFAILWLWTRIFGFSEISARFPSVIFGIATIYITYLIGKNVISNRAGIIAGLLLAINPLHIYYSQEARMYSFATFAVALNWYFFISLLQKKRLAMLFYSLSVALVLYSDYLAYFIFPAQFIYLQIYEKKALSRFIKGFGLGFLALIPWLFVFPQQIFSGQKTALNLPEWAKIVGGASIKNLGLVFVKSVIGRISIDNKFFYAVIISPILLIYSILIFFGVRKKIKPTAIFLIGILIPVILSFLVSFIVPAFSYFRVLFIVPAICLLVGGGIDALSRLQKPTFILVSAISIICLVTFYFNPKFQRENWKGLAQFLNSKNSPDAIVLFENPNNFIPYTYYDQHKILAQGALNKFPAREEGDLMDLKQVTENKKIVYLVNYLVDISDPKKLVDKKLTSLGFKIQRVDDFPSLGFVYEYIR